MISWTLFSYNITFYQQKCQRRQLALSQWCTPIVFHAFQSVLQKMSVTWPWCFIKNLQF